MKETSASYKLDFKYSFRDGALKDKSFSMTDFSRRSRYYDHYSSFDYSCLNALQLDDNRVNRIERQKEVDASPYMVEVEAAFQKWLKRREPIINAWNDYIEYWNDAANASLWEKQYNNVPPNGTPPTLISISNLLKNVRFRQMLETSRPFSIPVGSIVILADKYKNSWRYDPYYWGDHRNSPRVGTLVRYCEDVSGKGGSGSRLLEVMFFADGTKKEIPERALLIYENQKKE